MAAAYKATLVAAAGSPNGVRHSWALAGTDVVTAALTHLSGATAVTLNGKYDCYIIDLFSSAAPATITRWEIYLNGQLSQTIQSGTSIGTIYNRPLNMAPVFVPKGTIVEIVQN